MSTALAILTVFVVFVIVSDVIVTRRRNRRAIENMRREQGSRW